MNKNIPIVIIVLVLIAAVVTGVVLMNNSGKAPASNGNVKPGTAKTPNAEFSALYNAAPAGAQPAWSKGDPASKVVLEEFADFACPTCANFHGSLKEIEKSYGQRVRIIFHHFPLTIKGHENAYDAARAAEAAGIQGRFWEMQNMLFTNQEKWRTQTPDARKMFQEYAKSIGIDPDKFLTDMMGQVAAARVADDKRRADAIKVNSTPTVVLNGRLLTAAEITSTEGLRQAIEAELQKAAAPANNANANSNTNK
jgi:protein-disulfide isomerase